MVRVGLPTVCCSIAGCWSWSIMRMQQYAPGPGCISTSNTGGNRRGSDPSPAARCARIINIRYAGGIRGLSSTYRPAVAQSAERSLLPEPLRLVDQLPIKPVTV